MGGGSSKTNASSGGGQVATAPIKVDANAMAAFKQQII